MLRQQRWSLFADTQINPISDKVAKLMNIHQHLKKKHFFKKNFEHT